MTHLIVQIFANLISKEMPNSRIEGLSTKGQLISKGRFVIP
jgi:hypothetical protein